MLLLYLYAYLLHLLFTCSPVERERKETDMKAVPGPEESHRATSGREALNINQSGEGSDHINQSETTEVSIK